MKSTIENPAAENSEGNYPCLMLHHGTGWVVLLSSLREGTVVASDDPKDIGYVSSEWNPHSFAVFTGKVILEN
jgi:hypothetical protein